MSLITIKYKFNSYKKKINLKKAKMKAMMQKINFKQKANKSEIEKAILLNEQYSTNVRQLHLLLNQDRRLPKQKYLTKIISQLKKLQENMLAQQSLYQPYSNHALQSFLIQNDIASSFSLISLYQQKQNQIQKLQSSISTYKQQTTQNEQKGSKIQQLVRLRKQLQNKRKLRVDKQNKLDKIKEQFQQETKQFIKNKITNFDQQIIYRKLEQQTT